MSSFMTRDKSGSSEERGRVLPFEPRHTAAGRRAGMPGLGADPSPVPDVESYRHGGAEEDDDYRHRMKMNVIALMVVVLLVAGGLWIADTIAQMRKTQDCVLSGRRGCAPITVPNTSRY
jgi:hypothetical protein